jgi:hypothetical protein
VQPYKVGEEASGGGKKAVDEDRFDRLSLTG